MSKGNQRRGFIGSILMLTAFMFGSKGASTPSGGNHAGPHSSGMGWGGGAVHSPKRTKFKGYMRDPQYRAKRNKK